MLLICPASANDWPNKTRAMCYHVYVMMHVKDPCGKSRASCPVSGILSIWPGCDEQES